MSKPPTPDDLHRMLADLCLRGIMVAWRVGGLFIAPRLEHLPPDARELIEMHGEALRAQLEYDRALLLHALEQTTAPVRFGDASPCEYPGYTLMPMVVGEIGYCELLVLSERAETFRYRELFFQCPSEGMPA